MIAAGIVVGYLAGALLAARHEVYQSMVANEKSKFAGKQLEARLYSKQDLVDIANESRTCTYARRITREEVPGSDYTRVAMAGLFWWVYLIAGTIKILVMGGHKKTPGQREAELKAREEAAAQREAEAEALRRKYDQEFEDRMKEINDV